MPNGTAEVEPGSPEWCWQTLDGLVADYKLIDERFDEVGGALSQLKEVEAWKVIPADKPYGSLGRMLAMELGVDSKEIEREIRQARKRRKIAKQSGAPTGNTNASKNNDSNTTIVSDPIGRGRDYILARLDRDGETNQAAAELAADVRAGVIPASAAAERMGWRKPSTTQEVIFRLLPKLTPEQLVETRDKITLILEVQKSAPVT